MTDSTPSALDASELHSKTILLVDDNPTNLEVMAEFLESQGFTTLIARDGHSGLDKAIYAHPDLILLDVMMPGMDGFEACKRLKANPETNEIPVIFLTALAETPDKLQGFAVGGVDYVTKPIQQEELLARVTTHLRLRELTEHLEQVVSLRTAELNKAYRRLERLDRAKSDFIAVISHELRTPLTIIDGYSQLLKEEPAVISDDNLKERVAGILRGSSRMLEIINLMLDATRVDQGSLSPRRVNVELARVVGAICDSFSAALKDRNIQLDIRGLAELPLIQADSDLLARMFNQLVSNAIKYTPDGGKIEIYGQALAPEGEPPQVEVTVQDHGIGIDRSDLELIFEKFFRVEKSDMHSSSKIAFKGGGPGLGLSIAHGIAVVHGGRIWAESAGYDETQLPGSRFIVRLPIQPG